MTDDSLGAGTDCRSLTTTFFFWHPTSSGPVITPTLDLEIAKSHGGSRFMVSGVIPAKMVRLDRSPPSREFDPFKQDARALKPGPGSLVLLVAPFPPLLIYCCATLRFRPSDSLSEIMIFGELDFSSPACQLPFA